jgi:hypothetical protein
MENCLPRTYEEGHIPDVFNVTPVYKKHGKPIDDPNSYRRITVCSVIGKIFEKLVQAKIIDKLDSKQSKLQRGLLKAYHLQMLVYYLLKPSLSPWRFTMFFVYRCNIKNIRNMSLFIYLIKKFLKNIANNLTSILKMLGHE